MVKGNAAYERIISQRLVPHIYLNAEEALKYGGESFNILTEWVKYITACLETIRIIIKVVGISHIS